MCEMPCNVSDSKSTGSESGDDEKIGRNIYEISSNPSTNASKFRRKNP